MKKEGSYEPGYFHNLAHRLTNDPQEEIQGALEDVVNRKWDELTDKENSVLETEIKEAKVDVTNNGAHYDTQTSLLPANYDMHSYNVATGKEDDAPDMSYAFNPDIGWQNIRMEAAGEMKENLRASTLQLSYVPHFKDGATRIAVQAYNFINRSLNFILWDIAMLQGI